MVKRTRFAEYKDSYEHYKFELSPEGILFMQCHTNGGPLEWYWESHDRMSDAFADIAGDRDIKVVIHTGTGDTYNALWGKPVTDDQTPLYNAYADADGVTTMDEKAWFGRMIIENLLAIDVPMVAAVNGPCTHALRDPAAHGHRARLRRRVLPGPLALPAGDGARRRPARRLGPTRRSQSCPLPCCSPGTSSPRRRRASGASSRRCCPRTSWSTARGRSRAIWPCDRRSRSGTRAT